MRIFGGVLVAVFLPIFTTASPTKAPSEKTLELASEILPPWEHAEWKSWLARYTSSSPWIADKKNLPPHFLTDQKYLDTILTGNSVLRFEKPLYIGKIEHHSFDVFSSVEARRFEVFDQIDYALLGLESNREQALAQEDRNRQMRDHVMELITSRKPGELNIIFMVGAHAYDLFFRPFLTPDMSKTDPKAKIRDEVIYVGLPMTEETAFFTPDYENFVSATRGLKSETERVKDHSLKIAAGFLARLYYYNNLKRGIISKEAIVNEHPVKLANLIFMDTHYLRLEEPFKSMPTPQALKDLKIKKIVLALEGLKAGKFYQDVDIQRFYRIKESKNYSAEDLEYFKKFRKKAYDIYQTNFVTNLSIKSLHEKIKSYGNAGIEVVYTGLEEFERF